MSRIKFTTDSVCDIPASMLKDTGIQVIPFPIIMNGTEYQDGIDFTPDEFYPKLLAASQIPTHAQLTPYIFQECFEAAWQEGYTDLIHTSINSKGSSTYQNAVQARDMFYQEHPEAKNSFQIYLIDSLTYTMGYGWPILQAAELAKQGTSAPELVHSIQDWVDHVRVVFAALDLQFVKRSGRVSAAAAFMGEALGLKPIMTFENGASKILSKVRGEKAVIRALTELCQKERKPGTPYLIIRGNNMEQAQALTQACRDTLQEDAAMTYSVGCIVSVNAGPNVVGLVYRT